MKKGFTLVELLAVIVILAILLLIAMPQIIKLVKQSEVNGIRSTAKMIIHRAEEKYVENEVLQIDDTIQCDDLVKLDDTYGDCFIKLVDNVWNVEVRGSNTGKLKNLMCKGTKDNLVCGKISEFKKVGYFKAYDGEVDLFGFDKSGIKRFERNTELTLEEVDDMYTDGVAKKINNTDSQYNSEYDIYAWISDNVFNWWSDADIVYFHPNTRNAFKNNRDANINSDDKKFDSLISIDLTGTDTSLVKNFSHWFDSDIALTKIIGTINTDGLEYPENSTYDYEKDTNNDASSHEGMAYMFNDCKALTSVDLSKLNTSNAIDMKRMLAGTTKLASIDVSNFDTSKVKSMYWMFRNAKIVTELDLSNFDTSNVTNMFGMFFQDSNLKTVYFGNKFDTSNVKNMSNMFYGGSNLTTIYAKIDFVKTNGLLSKDMFRGCNKLVGGDTTAYKTPFDGSKINATYAQIANESHSGYFTSNVEKYSITYKIRGGSLAAENPSVYYENSEITLNNPTDPMPGYTFIGWTGSNGNTPQMTVTIPLGSSGDRTYIANYSYKDDASFPIVFAIHGTCTFNGSTSNITSKNNDCKNVLNNKDYTNDKYIDTEIFPFNSDNYSKDFEIYFEIDDYNPDNQESETSQNTIMSAMLENSKLKYPGIVFRRDGTGLELRGKELDSSAKEFQKDYTYFKTVRVVRNDGKMYYSINGGALTKLVDDLGLSVPHNAPVLFGAARDSSNKPFRHINGQLSYMYIRLGDYDE